MDTISKLPNVVQPFDDYLLLLFHVVVMKMPPIVQDEIASPRKIKRHFRALKGLVRESGEQVVFSSVLSVARRYIGKNRLFRRDRRGRRGGGVALCIMKWAV